MSARPLRHGIRAATALAAAALLGLAGCTTAEDPPDPETSAVEQDGADDDQDSADDGQGDDSARTDDTDAEGDGGPDDDAPTAGDETDDPADEGTGPADVPGSDEGRTLVFIHVVEPERLVDHGGEMRLPAADLAEILQDMGGPAEEPAPGSDPADCGSDLRYVASADVECTVTAAFDGSEREMTMYAQPIAAPGGGHGILYTADDPLTEDGRWATYNGANEVTAIGMGGAYGMDPIPAERLVADMQTVIDFDFTHDPVDTSQWTFTVQECAGGLDFDRLAPVRCTATHDDTGAEHTAWALPGTFFGQEPGLIVSIETVPAGE